MSLLESSVEHRTLEADERHRRITFEPPVAVDLTPPGGFFVDWQIDPDEGGD